MKNPGMGRRTLTFLCCLLAVPACAQVVPGIHADSLQTAVLAGALLGVAYLVLRPVLRVLTLPIGCLTLGLFGFVIDVALIYMLPWVFPGFQVEGLLAAALSAILVNAMCMVVGGFK